MVPKTARHPLELFRFLAANLRGEALQVKGRYLGVVRANVE